MEYIASFDIGTTNVKGILVDQQLNIANVSSRPIRLLEQENMMEQNPDDWIEAVYAIVKEWIGTGFHSDDIRLISFSGQMQDLILLDAELRPVRPAILYSDDRAAVEAEAMKKHIGVDRIEEITANPFNGTLPLPKLQWVKTHEPEHYERTAHIVISSKDYVVARLTGRAVTDSTAASTSGAMDVRINAWSAEMIESVGLDRDRFAPILNPDEIVGYVGEEAAQASGLKAGTPVLCGIGDAGAATLGAGVYSSERSYIYLGTTGWAATSSEVCHRTDTGMFNLAYCEPQRYISIAPILNGGNAHAWAAATYGAILEDGEPDLVQFERMVEEGLSKPNQLLFLPYMNGERCPVQDMNASGCYVGVRSTTTKAEMAAAVLEGVAMSLRQVMEHMSSVESTSEVMVIGGGAKSKAWCQLLADVIGVRLKTPHNAQHLPSLGAALLGFIQLGWGTELSHLLEEYVSSLNYDEFHPNKASYYETKYEQYCKLYPTLSSLWQ